MHILIVTDQHPDSLGGVQVALRLQRRFLERAGHTVSIAAPALHRRGYSVAGVDRRSYIDLPSMPITRDREYGISLPGRGSDRALDRALAEREAAGVPPVDLVHVQGDFWGAMIGLRAAKRYGLPLMVTMHNNVDQGTRAVTPLAPLVFAGLRVWLRAATGRPERRVRRDRTPGASAAWTYLADIASRAELVTAPSQHFAAELERHRVLPREGGMGSSVRVTSGGVDDDLIAHVRGRTRTPRDRPRLVWLGRMSGEKRILEFIDAFAESNANADVILHGAGLLLGKVERRISELGLNNSIHVAGPVPYEQALEAIHNADALVQTSVGFETQGLTPFEAASLGTPTVFCDPNIQRDLGVEPSWLAADASVTALADVLARAVGELSENPGGVRVDAAVGAQLLQSAKTGVMIELYESVLADTK